MKNNLRAFILTLACVAGLVSTPALAGTLLAFGSSGYSTTSPNFSRTVTASGGTDGDPWVYTNAFSSTISLTPSSGYSGPAVYGGYVITSTAQAAAMTERIQNNLSINSVGYDAPLVLASRTESAWSGTLTTRGVMLLDLDTPASIDGITATTTKYGSAVSNVTCRWVVDIDGSYYVSSATFTANNNGGTASLSDATLSDTTWALYDPATSLAFTGSSFAALSLENVSAVGVYFSASQSLTSGSVTTGFGFGLAALTITGTETAIPEPAACALLAGGCALGLIVLRRRLRNAHRPGR